MGISVGWADVYGFHLAGQAFDVTDLMGRPAHTYLLESTTDPDGILHSESKVPNQKPAKLGQFFTEWGVRLDDQCVGEFCSSNTQIAVYVNGQKVSGNPADIELKSHLEIAVVIGKPPDQIPSSWEFLDNQP